MYCAVRQSIGGPATTDTFQPPRLLGVRTAVRIAQRREPSDGQPARLAPKLQHQPPMQLDLSMWGKLTAGAVHKNESAITHTDRVVRRVHADPRKARHLPHLESAKAGQPDLPETLLPVCRTRHAREEALRAPRHVVAREHDGRKCRERERRPFVVGEHGGLAPARASPGGHRGRRGRLLVEEKAVEGLGRHGGEVAGEKDHAGAWGEEARDVEEGVWMDFCRGV